MFEVIETFDIRRVGKERQEEGKNKYWLKSHEHSVRQKDGFLELLSETKTVIPLKHS